MTKETKCECSDPGCDCAALGHKGRSRLLYRVDMEDRTGTLVCELCCDDALDSSLFSFQPLHLTGSG